MARNDDGKVERGPGDIDLFASVKLVVAYEVRGDRDTNEGRGGTYLVGYFVDEHLAYQAAKGKGVMGYEGSVKRQEVLTVTFKTLNGDMVTCKVGDPVSFIYEDPAETKARALGKLSLAKKKALGLV